MAISRRSGNSTTNASPESAHSLSVPSGSASSRLRGIVLMSMKLLPSHDQLVADLPPNDQKDDLGSLHIVQDAEGAHAQFELGEGVRPQPLDRPRWRGRPVLEPRQDGGFQDTAVARR